MTKQRALSDADEYLTGRHVYLVVDPAGGPVQAFPRGRAFEYAANTGSVVARADVVTLNAEEAR